jgi:DNA-binding NtrC family response regulator
MARERLLVVDNEESVCLVLAMMLEKESYEVRTALSGEEALKWLEKEYFHVVITDIRMPGIDGLELLDRVNREFENLPVILLTAQATLDSAIEAVNKGAFYFIRKPFKKEEILLQVRKAIELQQVRDENVQLKRELKTKFNINGIIGKSEGIQKVFRIIEKVAQSNSTVLITGESGTGKELIAKAIHYSSRRSDAPFQSINCGALPEALLESELFGHMKGSFTGAYKNKEGLLTVARHGTFFLDEIGETPSSIQVKLLRAIQEREIIPVGGVKSIAIDVRFIAATNSNLEDEVRNGNFRSDFYYRLNVIPLRIPPLRERKDDIPLLIDHFLKHCCKKAGIAKKEMSREAMKILIDHPWPGNVRELENVIERTVILQEGEVIYEDDLPEKIRQGLNSCDPRHNILNQQVSLEELERQYIEKVLVEYGWHRKMVAKVLGIDPSTLYRKLQKYGLEQPVPSV